MIEHQTFEEIPHKPPKKSDKRPNSAKIKKNKHSNDPFSKTFQKSKQWKELSPVIDKEPPTTINEETLQNKKNKSEQKEERKDNSFDQNTEIESYDDPEQILNRKSSSFVNKFRRRISEGNIVNSIIGDDKNGEWVELMH